MFVLLVNTLRSILQYALTVSLARTLPLFLLENAQLALKVNTLMPMAPLYAPTASKVILLLLVVQSAAVAPRVMSVLP
jgi:hypothetical protein